MDELLKLENISYWYDNKYLALDNVSASFCVGERVVVLGCNGAGKSTFFLCCNGVLRPQSGNISYMGRKISNSKKDISLLRQGVGLVFQNPDSQIIAGSVESEVSFGPMNLGLSHDDVSTRVEYALEQMDLAKHRDHAPHFLSCGEKKRVSIADILAMHPRIILMDEPTASLDPKNMDSLVEIMDKLNNNGVTIIVSTHDVDFAFRIGNRAIVFSEGRIVADSTVDEVFASSNTLQEAGLKKPLLYEMCEILQGQSIAAPVERKPRTIEEFRSQIANNNR